MSRYLADRAGHDFAFLADRPSDRARRSIATIIRENLDPTSSVIGIEVKVIVGAIFASVVDDEALAADMRALARQAGVDADRLEAVAAFARGEWAILPGLTESIRAALHLALAASPADPGREFSFDRGRQRLAVSWPDFR